MPLIDLFTDRRLHGDGGVTGNIGAQTRVGGYCYIHDEDDFAGLVFVCQVDRRLARDEKSKSSYHGFFITHARPSRTILDTHETIARRYEHVRIRAWCHVGMHRVVEITALDREDRITTAGVVKHRGHRRLIVVHEINPVLANIRRDGLGDEAGVFLEDREHFEALVRLDDIRIDHEYRQEDDPEDRHGEDELNERERTFRS